MAIDWGLLQPSNVGGALQAGVQAGRAQAKQQATDNALAAFALHPNDPASASALLPFAPDLAFKAMDQQRKDLAAQNETFGRSAYATYLREHATPGIAPTPSAPAPQLEPEQGGSAPMPGSSAPSPTAPNGDIVVTGRRPTAPMAPTVSLADVAQYSPELSQQLTAHMGALDKNGREEFSNKMGIAAAVAQGAMQFPESSPQRQAFIDDHAEYLRHGGWTDRELANFDPHNANLNTTIALGIGADKFLTAQGSAAAHQETARHNRFNEGQGAARLSLSRSALGLAQARERRIASGGGTTADLSGASDDALLRLAGGE